MPKRNTKGFIDPISIIGVLMLVITLVVGTKVASDKGFSLNIIEQAKKPEKTGNAAYDECREESGREVCNERLGTNINWKGEDKTVYEQPAAPEAPVVTTVPISNTLEKEEAAYINKVVQQETKQQVVQKQITEPVSNAIEKEEIDFINEIAQQETKQQAVVQQEPIQQTVTQTQVVDQQTYTPPETYTPPLLTVPAFTAEDLLRKLPGLENLNINDFKELNYPTINKPDPAIITNTFANPILDNSQNISWYDQPLDIPALEFNLESTKPTVESEIKKLTDPLFNYILDYFSKYLPGISLP
jgi:hypothetical protein